MTMKKLLNLLQKALDENKRLKIENKCLWNMVETKNDNN